MNSAEFNKVLDEEHVVSNGAKHSCYNAILATCRYPYGHSEADATIAHFAAERIPPLAEVLDFAKGRILLNIEIKREALSIQDSISAESIGQLPDTTITDALQRITGVQINRDAGGGTSVSVRGLPEVGTLLNGEVFISPDQIDSQQPDFTTLPATLFNQVDVIKAPIASQTETGISGALNLHTYRPWDLPSGFTYSYSADAERGSTSRKTGPEASALVAYNADGRWGLQVSGDF